MKVSDLQTKDVVNISDGRILGQVRDIKLKVPEGTVESLIVPGESRWFGLKVSGPVFTISWRQIERIGTDVILVRLVLEDQEILPLQDEIDSWEASASLKGRKNNDVPKI
uniref:YlmC n=1 Tax=Pasteuria ramosa TaxID=225322 RepID=Q1KT24_9BACL|nr:YlmC [Pasteuria ramosa]